MHTAVTARADNKITEPMPLPASLGECTAENKGFVQVAEDFMSRQSKALSRDDLFEAVAQHYFPEWREARGNLALAQKNLDKHDLPLGSIGMALDGGVMTGLEDKVMQALVDFTMINERLHQDKGVKAAIDMLHHIQTTLRSSAQVTLSALTATKQFEVVAPAPNAPKQDDGVVQSNWMKGSLTDSFRNHRQKRLSGSNVPFHHVLNGGLRHLLRTAGAPQKELKVEKTTASTPGMKTKI